MKDQEVPDGWRKIVEDRGLAEDLHALLPNTIFRLFASDDGGHLLRAVSVREVMCSEGNAYSVFTFGDAVIQIDTTMSVIRIESRIQPQLHTDTFYVEVTLGGEVLIRMNIE